MKKSIEHGKSIMITNWLNDNCYLPSPSEQTKIIDFINKINIRIKTQKKIICLLESQINQIRNTLINTIEKQHSFILFGDIIEEYNEKTTDNNMYPVLSSTKYGIQLQSLCFINPYLLLTDET